MPVNQITAGQKDWLATLNNNSALLNKLPVDGAVSTNSGITFKNGASAQNFKCWYVQFNGFKLVNMAFDQLDCPMRATQNQSCQCQLTWLRLIRLLLHAMPIPRSTTTSQPILFGGPTQALSRKTKLYQ